MPVNPQNIQRPPSPVAKTYTPPGGRSYPVKLNDSWASLAAAEGMAPWDLIHYNYPGLPTDLKLAAKYVNWYLENYAGCTLTTPDGRNYRFSPPAKIWLPPSPPRPVAALTPDQIARNRVLAVLRSPAAKRLNFGVGYLILTGSHYEEIAKAIEAGKIVVKDNPSLGHIATYNGWSTPGVMEMASTVNDGLIIHECTHAIFDMLKLTTRVDQSEGFAYISQALYGWLQRGGPPASRYMVSPDHADPASWVSWQMIFDESERIAGVLSRKHWVDVSEVSSLYSAIRGANIYRPKVGKKIVYNGV